MTKRYKEAPIEPLSNQAIATRPRGCHSRKPFCPKWPTRRTSQIEPKCFHARFPNVRALQVKVGKLKQSSVQNQMATKLFWIRNLQRFPRDGNWLGVDRLKQNKNVLITRTRTVEAQSKVLLNKIIDLVLLLFLRDILYQGLTKRIGMLFAKNVMRSSIFTCNCITKF